MSDPPQAEHRRERVIFLGRVQGVGFRALVSEVATGRPTGPRLAHASAASPRSTAFTTQWTRHGVAARVAVGGLEVQER